MKKIIWAIDPWQEPKQAKNLIHELRAWANAFDCKVQPVAVIPNSPMDFEISFQWKKEIERVTDELVENYIEKTRTGDFLAPVKLYITSLSTRKMALELIKYSESVQAAFIFCNTQAKPRWNPFRLGSFAETLVAASRTPVLLLNPNAHSSKNIKSILFPTDFSKDAKNALARVEPLAKAMNSKILLYNQVELPSLYAPEYSVAWQNMDLLQMSEDLEKIRKKKASAWAHRLEKGGVRSGIVVEQQHTFVSDAILKQAKKNKVDLIAMVSRSGQVLQAVVGSVARDILMKAQCPVLVFYKPHPSTNEIRRPVSYKRERRSKELSQERLAQS